MTVLKGHVLLHPIHTTLRSGAQLVQRRLLGDVTTNETCPLRLAGYSCRGCKAEGAPYCTLTRAPVYSYIAAFALLAILVAIFVISLHVYFPAHR